MPSLVKGEFELENSINHTSTNLEAIARLRARTIRRSHPIVAQAQEASDTGCLIQLAEVIKADFRTKFWCKRSA